MIQLLNFEEWDKQEILKKMDSIIIILVDTL